MTDNTEPTQPQPLPLFTMDRHTALQIIRGMTQQINAWRKALGLAPLVPADRDDSQRRP